MQTVGVVLITLIRSKGWFFQILHCWKWLSRVEMSTPLPCGALQPPEPHTMEWSRGGLFLVDPRRQMAEPPLVLGFFLGQGGVVPAHIHPIHPFLWHNLLMVLLSCNSQRTELPLPANIMTCWFLMTFSSQALGRSLCTVALYTWIQSWKLVSISVSGSWRRVARSLTLRLWRARPLRSWHPLLPAPFTCTLGLRSQW